jgi:hypothetical protein
MKLVGVVEPKLLKGQLGMYYKFADGLSHNGEPIELYFKPKFIKGAWITENDNLNRITWLEINILWVGPADYPEFTGGWSPLRRGRYSQKSNPSIKGTLLGKIMVPMGEFNEDLPRMHKWVQEHSGDIQKYIDTTLLPQVHGKTYMPLPMMFDHMVEVLNNDVIIVEDTQVFLNKEFQEKQQEFAAKAKAKYAVPESDESPDVDD